MIENDLFNKIINTKTDHSPVFEIDTNDSFKTLAESIFHYLKQGEKIPESLIEVKFKELLFNITLNSKNESLLNYFKTIKHSVKTNIESVMINNFQYDLKMEDFAKLCGRSLSAFKRDFKSYFETTPSRWLIAKRLEYAKTLLLGSVLSTSEICYESGFKNNSHFIRAFKSKYNLPPNQFKVEYTKE
jgi:AraC-like DNA-binding protein